MHNNIYELKNYQEAYVLAIGNFDGLHLGHRALLEETLTIKKKLNIKSALMTFDPHPLVCLTSVAPKYLIDNQEKAFYAKEYFAIDEVFFIKFDKSFAGLTPEDFLVRALLSDIKIKHVIVGHNFTFGKFGKGDPDYLKDFCQRNNIGVSIIPLVTSEYGVVSSTSIREHLAQGDLVAANEMLGYWYNFAGTVKRGRCLGKTIGFPTANIEPSLDRQIPKTGVYAVYAEYEEKIYQGIANFGYRPTIVGNQDGLLLEVNLFTKEDLDLYGGELRIYFGKYLREEKKFQDLEQLKKQIITDIYEAKQFLRNNNFIQCLPKKIK